MQSRYTQFGVKHIKDKHHDKDERELLLAHIAYGPPPLAQLPPVSEEGDYSKTQSMDFYTFQYLDEATVLSAGTLAR